MDHFLRQPDGTWVVETAKRGRAVLREPLLNKGTAFDDQECGALGLRGLLPAGVASPEQQLERVWEALRKRETPLLQYVELADLQDRNETLFYKALTARPAQLMPIVYTPTVGEASLNFSHIFRRSRGRWISPKHRGQIADVLGEVAGDIRLIVVTDNERILGLGDQGAGGMVIPVGKLALYTAGAGIHPSLTLPVSLDVGTDNPRLLEDPMYLGWRHPRLRGAEYDELVEEFVQAVQRLFPRALLQWEDFKKANAFTLLHRYRDRLLSFNDDIQGTAAVAVAGLMAAVRAKGERLRDQRVVIMGAGAAGVGIGELLREAMGREGATADEQLRAVAVIDSQGLLLTSRDLGEAHKRPFAWTPELAGALGVAVEPVPMLPQVVAGYRPTALIGTTGQPGIFDKAIIRAMAAHVARPIVFPLSNPTSKSEAHPHDLLNWTEGRALVATGSPFDLWERGGESRHISQGNNVYIFPGVGLGALAVSARRVTDSMFAAAADTLAGLVSEEHLSRGRLYPPIDELRVVTRHVGIAVAREAIAAGAADEPAEGVEAAVTSWIWEPEYPTIRAV